MTIQIPRQSVLPQAGNVTLAGTQVTPQSQGAGFASEVAKQAAIAGQKANLAISQENSNNLSAWTNNAIYGEDGLHTKKGRNALEAQSSLMASFDQYTSDQLSQINSRSQRKAYELQTAAARTKLETDSLRYQQRELQVYETQQQAAYLENQQLDAQVNYQNPERITESISSQAASIVAQGELNGESMEVINAKVMGAASATHVGVVNRMLSNQEYQTAKSHLEENKSQILPQQYDRAMKTIRSAEAAQTAQAKQRLNAEIQDYLAFKNTGGEATRDYTQAQLQAVYGKEQGDAIYAEIQDANQFAEQYQTIQFATPDDLTFLIQQNQPTSPEDFRRESSQFQTLARAVQQRQSELMGDPAKFVLENKQVQNEYRNYQATGDGKPYAEASIAEQEILGIPQELTTILSKENASSMVEQFKTGGQTASQFMQSLRQQFGPYYSNVVKDLNAAGLPEAAQVVAIMPDGNAANQLSTASQTGFNALKSAIGSDDFKDVNDTIADSLSEFQDTLSLAANGPSTWNKIRNATQLLAMQYVSQGQSTRDAVKTAANQVINDQYTFYDGYRVPNTKEVDGIRSEVDSVNVRRGVDQNLRTILDTDLLPPYDPFLPPEVAQEQYKKMLQPTAITMNDDSGVIFVDQQGDAILDAAGNPIIRTWDDLTVEGIAIPESPLKPAAEITPPLPFGAGLFFDILKSFE